MYQLNYLVSHVFYLSKILTFFKKSSELTTKHHCCLIKYLNVVLVTFIIKIQFTSIFCCFDVTEASYINLVLVEFCWRIMDQQLFQYFLFSDS